jgi:small GTP-binding protein
MLKKFLSVNQEEIIKKERDLLFRLNGVLSEIQATDEDKAIIAREAQRLDELFMIVVVGEFNAGKSAFINALLGADVLEEGVTPTTQRIHVIKYGETPSREERDGLLYVFYPALWLKDLNIVDTPGTNAVLKEHQIVTEKFVPHSDFVLFITSSDRPFTESERVFVELIRNWGKKIVAVVNKADLLDSEVAREKVLSFVTSHLKEVVGTDPKVFLVSSRLAKEARKNNDLVQWEESGMQEIEQFLQRSFTEKERVRLKLTTPLQVSERLAERYLTALEEQKRLLVGDLETVHEINAQLEAYEREMRTQFVYHLSHVENVLNKMEHRGNEFFEETIRLTRIFDMLNAEKIRGEFERKVIADTAHQVERQINDLIDWMVAQDFRQWRQIASLVEERMSKRSKPQVGLLNREFERRRKELLESVGESAKRAVETYDREAEARELADSVQSAVAQAALVEVSAIGLGTILVKVLATTMADLTGILAASTLAAVGLYLIPARKRKAQKKLHESTEKLRNELRQALQDEFDIELQRSISRIRDALAPYTSFVETEERKLEHQGKQLEDILTEARELAKKVSG